MVDSIPGLLGAAGSFIVAVLGALGLFLKVSRQVEQSNAVTLAKRVADLEANASRQDVINQHLTGWQYNAREAIRLLTNGWIEMGRPLSAALETLQGKLNEEIDYASLYTDAEITRARRDAQ